MRLLVIEDEPRMLELLRTGLQERNCAVMTATDGESGLEIAAAHQFDAILLDIGLPCKDGYELIRELRRRECPTRVLMLTARDGEDDIVRGLDLGADDYMTKPFSFLELMARLNSITRMRPEHGTGRIEAGNLALDPIRRTVTRDRTGIELTRSEFNLLAALMRSAGLCVSRQTLMQSVWGSDTSVGQGALDVLVNSLRGKIDAPFQQKLVQTVRGSGYLLECGSGQMERTS